MCPSISWFGHTHEDACMVVSYVNRLKTAPLLSPLFVQVREGDVEIVYNHSGRSTGIAYVTFSSRSVASKAVREKDGKHIGHRYVELSFN